MKELGRNDGEARGVEDGVYIPLFRKRGTKQVLSGLTASFMTLNHSSDVMSLGWHRYELEEHKA